MKQRYEDICKYSNGRCLFCDVPRTRSRREVRSLVAQRKRKEEITKDMFSKQVRGNVKFYDNET